MSTTKHTPGPWTLGDENNACAEVCAGRTIICFDRVEGRGSSGQYVIGRDEMLANVHLVIAAPEMLEALEMVLENLPRLWGDDVHDGVISLKHVSEEAVDLALAAIEKARGGAR